MVASRTQSQGVVVEILIDHKIGMNHNLESIRIDSTDSDSISVQIANRITMGESIRKATVKTPLPRRALLFDVAREPTAPSADSAAASTDGPATTTSVPVSARAGGGGLGRPRMTLQQLLVCCAASGLCASVVSESRPLDFTVSGNFKEALPAAVEPLRQALLSYLHGLQRLTGCELHVIFPDHGDIECLPAHDLGPLSFAAAKRRFAAALRTQAASAPGPVPGHASSSPDDSPADPCHVMGVGASEQGTYTWCCKFKLQPESATDNLRAGKTLIKPLFRKVCQTFLGPLKNLYKTLIKPL